MKGGDEEDEEAGAGVPLYALLHSDVLRARRAASAPCLGPGTPQRPDESTPLLLHGKGQASGARTNTSSTIATTTPTAAAPPTTALGSIRPLPPLGESLRVLPFLCICAMAGVLTRIGMSELFGPSVLNVTSNESETFPDWFANAWGSLVMGFLAPMRQYQFFARRSWLYIGLTTGYCGCTTTFSSWNQDAATLIVRTDRVGQMVTYCLILLDGIAVPLFCFIVGRHLQTFMLQVVTALKRRVRKPSPDEVAARGLEDEKAATPVQQGNKQAPLSHGRMNRKDVLYCLAFIFCLLTLCAAWFVLIDLGGVTNRYIWIACLFGPWGAILRYVLSRYNTWRRCARFPFFTFLVNVIGSLGLALTVVGANLQGYDTEHDAPGYILRGFQVGFFGSLTTVSTFIGELYTLPSVPYAYIYGFLSIIVTQSALVLINGLYTWV